MLTNSSLLKSESEIKLANLKKLNEEVQVLEQQFFGEAQNVHDEETLKENISHEAYNNYVSETEKYIQHLKKENRIKNNVQEALELESFLGLDGTQLYGQHNKEFWENEILANNYLQYLRRTKDLRDLQDHTQNNVNPKETVKDSPKQKNTIEISKFNQNETVKLNSPELKVFINQLEHYTNNLKKILNVPESLDHSETTRKSQEKEAHLKNVNKIESPLKSPTILIQFNSTHHNYTNYNSPLKEIQPFNDKYVDKTSFSPKERQSHLLKRGTGTKIINSVLSDITNTQQKSQGSNKTFRQDNNVHFPNSKPQLKKRPLAEKLNIVETKEQMRLPKDENIEQDNRGCCDIKCSIF